MSDIKIELIDSMGDDLRVSNVARVSFDRWKEEFDQKDVSLINYLAAHEHTSPFRHTAITVRCKAPVFIARQLGKHQAGLSWNEVSRRYVDVGIEFFSPDSWRSRPVDGMKQGSGEDVDAIKTALIDEAYEVHLDECMKLYDGMIDLGVAPEQARMVLPQSMMVDWVWTGNLFAFYHVYRLRIDGHAQKEAQEFAQKLGTILEDLFPHCMKALKNDSAKN